MPRDARLFPHQLIEILLDRVQQRVQPFLSERRVR
jgi:hypothetical protein